MGGFLVGSVAAYWSLVCGDLIAAYYLASLLPIGS
jgi:hypothetical protein